MTRPSPSLGLMMLASSVLFTSAQESDGVADKFMGCDVSEYYSSLGNDWREFDKDGLQDVLTNTHRNFLTSFPSPEFPESIMEALIDLWPGQEEGTVRLIYRDVDMRNRPYNGLENWRKENLWPTTRGARESSPAFNDVHSTAPGDWNVLDAKIAMNPSFGLLFGNCGTVSPMENCITPADPETGPETSTDTKIWLPPPSARGAIARGLFYNALRYPWMSLTDCPPFFEGEYGYLSELLQWHKDYPPTDAERRRNDQACRRWQGNRNPFIDYPDLVPRFYGEPDSILPNTFTYSACTDPTEAPTATPNECSGLRVGDVMVFGFNSVDPDQILFFPLFNIPSGVGSLFITNRPWNGEEILDGPGGTIELVIPDEGISAGRVFGYNVAGSNVTTVESSQVNPEQIFDLNPDGDHMLIYCINADDKPHFIHGLTFRIGWAEQGLSEYPVGSALPSRLARDGNVALGDFKNWFYNGTQEANAAVLIPAFADPDNWAGSDVPYDIPNSGAVSSNLGLHVVTLSVLFVSLLW